MRELETKLLEGNVQVILVILVILAILAILAILVILVVWGSFERRSCKNMMHQMASICQQQRDYKLHPTTASVSLLVAFFAHLLHQCRDAEWKILTRPINNNHSWALQQISHHIFIQASSGCKPPPATTAEPPPKKVLIHFMSLATSFQFSGSVHCSRFHL